MSYEPTLVIDYNGLRAHREALDAERWDLTDHYARCVSQLLYEVSCHDPKTIKGVEVVITAPNGTSFNSAVRTKLDALGVEYIEDY